MVVLVVSDRAHAWIMRETKYNDVCVDSGSLGTLDGSPNIGSTNWREIDFDLEKPLTRSTYPSSRSGPVFEKRIQSKGRILRRLRLVRLLEILSMTVCTHYPSQANLLPMLY